MTMVIHWLSQWLRVAQRRPRPTNLELLSFFVLGKESNRQAANCIATNREKGERVKTSTTSCLAS
jgi:hypothetical protein